MSFDKLSRRLCPAFLNNPVVYDLRPCRLFLSASDMKSRAVTAHSSNPDPADAWTFALADLKSSLGNIKPTILRADWIVDSTDMTWSKFLELIGKTRRNYFRCGVALDPDFNVAFTESELNANGMIYRDGKSGSKYCVLRPERCDDYCRLRFGRDFPALEPDSPVVVFTTCGMFVSDAEPEVQSITGTDLAAGHRDASHIDDRLILDMVRNGAQHLARQVQKSGRFVYGRYPCFDKIVSGYNSLRHFSSIFSMLDVYETYGRLGSPALGAAINKALRYGVQTFIKTRTLQDGSTAAYVVDPTVSEIKLGALGVTLLALVKHAGLMRTKKYIPLMNEIADGIMSMQKDDGSFVHVLDPTDFSVKEPFRIVYYDGEAVFGMMRLYSITKDERLLAASELAFKRFIATDHWKNHDHWLSYAVNELTTYQPRREYFEFGINNFLTFLPFIYHRDTQFPTLMELMMAADTMLERMKSMPEMSELLSRVNFDDFHAAMESRAKNLMNGYFYPELAMHFKNPDSILGSFFIRHHAFRVRIDDVEHFLSGLTAYRRYVARRDHDPVPSKALLEGKAEGTGLFNIQSTDKPEVESSEPGDQPSSDRASSDRASVESSETRLLNDALEHCSITVDEFRAEFDRRRGVVMFMLRAIKDKPSGIEFSAFRRAQMFKQCFGIDVRFCTHEYQNDITDRLAAHGLDNPILNMYDHYQGIDRRSESERIAELPEISSDCIVEYVEDNFVVRRDGKPVMYCIFDSDNLKLRYINYFEGNRKVQRDWYDTLGFLSRRQTLEPISGAPLSTEYFRPDGSTAIRETFRVEGKKAVLQSFEVLERDGRIVHSFKTHEEAIARWVFELVDNDRRTYFVIGDRTPEYTDAYIKLKSEGKFGGNNFIAHQLHNIHFNLRDGQTRTRHQYLITDKLKSDAILTLTERQYGDLRERYTLDNIVVLPHSLPGVERAPRTNFDRFRVVQVGRFVEEKGHAKSIEAFKRVLEAIPQATLHFYGSGDLRDDIQSKIDAAGLGQSVIIEGFTSDIPSVFANAALSLLPSTFEGSPLVVQESMQQGCPVVAFDCKYGPSDMIEDGVNGYLVPVNDIDGLAARIKDVLSNEGLQKSMSEASARSVEKFTRQKIAERWAKLFHTLLHRNKRQ